MCYNPGIMSKSTTVENESATKVPLLDKRKKVTHEQWVKRQERSADLGPLPQNPGLIIDDNTVDSKVVEKLESIESQNEKIIELLKQLLK